MTAHVRLDAYEHARPADPEHPDTPIAVSAFAGVGGIDLGMELAGIHTAVQIEWDAAASRVLEQRFPDATRFSDVREVSSESVSIALGGRRPDVLVGGFPCQDLSVAGRRAGLAGKRSGLYGELLRLAHELDPDWLVVENVPGLLSSAGGDGDELDEHGAREAGEDEDPDAERGPVPVRPGAGVRGSDFALFLGDLTGFEPAVPDGGWRSSGVCHGPRGTCAWRVLDAQHFGVAQRRRRVFVVFHPRDRAAPAAVLLEPEGVRRDLAAGSPPRPRASRPVGDAAVRERVVGDGRGGAPQARPLRVAEDGAGGPAAAELTSTLQGGGTRGWRLGAEEAAGGQVVPVTNALDGDVARSLMAAGSSDPHDASQSTYVAEPERSAMVETGQGFWTEAERAATLRVGGDPDTVVDEPGVLPVAGALTRSSHTMDDAGVGGGLLVPVHEGPGHDPGDISPTVTSKWAKGSGGPAGNETGNLVATGVDVYNGELTGDVAHTVRGGHDQGVPRVLERDAYEIDKERGLPNDEGISVKATDVAPTITADGDPTERTDRGLRIVEPGLDPDAAYSVQVRGRDGGANVELGDPDVYTALRAGDGGSSRQPLVLPPSGDYAPDVAAPLTAGSHAPGVSAPGRRQEDDVNLVTYRKSKRAQTDQDDETWVEADRANTLNTHDNSGDTRATELVVEPLTFSEGATGQAVSDTAPTLQATQPGETSSRQTAVVQPEDPVAFNALQDPTASPVSPTLGDGHGSSGVGVAIPINADALRGEGAAATPSADAEGRVRLRDPGLGVGEDGDPAGTLAAAGPGAVGVDVYNAADSGPISPTVSATTGTGIHGVRDPARPTAAVRRLTPTECERLQGFPDGWTDIPGTSDSARYKQLGNAVAVPVAAWVGWRIQLYRRGLLTW